MDYIDTPDFYLNRLEKLVDEQQETIRQIKTNVMGANVKTYNQKISELDTAIVSISRKLMKQGYDTEVSRILVGKVLV